MEIVSAIQKLELVSTIAFIALAVIFGVALLTFAIYAIIRLMKRHDEKVARQARIEVYKALMPNADSKPKWIETVDIRDLDYQKSGRYPWGDDKED